MPRHHCRHELHLIIMEGSETGDNAHTTTVQSDMHTLKGKHISLVIHLMVELPDPNAITFWGYIGMGPLMALLDCGATHNFIASDLAEKLHLPLAFSCPFSIILSNGVVVEGTKFPKAFILTC